ncbi:MAG: RlmE family RNA methyltransferase [Myxococcales bacterium]|nr:RlmE family RNA methyltransferase [Myxococcales bacterium]
MAARRSRSGKSRGQTGRPQDHFGKRAKKEGFAARSIYKLEEIDRRLRILKQGQRILDLGAYPGSWTQFAAQQVGKNGRVLGIDIQEHTGALPPHAEIRHADIFEITLESLGEDPFDVVLSDMAPNTSGHRDLDQMRSFELFMRALDIAKAMLKPGGAFVGKIFQGGDFPEAKRAVAEAFDSHRIIKPDATRSESFETFVIGMGRKA